MRFEPTDMEAEARELQEMIDSDQEVKEHIETFNHEYNFRKKLVAARKEAGLTQKELGEKSGIPYRAISRMETDANITPNLRTVLKSLSALGYELDVVKMSAGKVANG